MMFLQFGVYGLWLPIAGRFLVAGPEIGGLGFSEAQAGAIVGFSAAIGAICSPLIVQFADRRFPAQKFLGVLMILGGLLKLAVFQQSSFAAWITLSIAFTVLFMPAVAICNALPMPYLSEPSRQWPAIRLWTSIAWMTVGWIFSLIVLTKDAQPAALPPFFQGAPVPMIGSAMRESILWSGCLAIGYGIWAYAFLPHTLPVQDQTKKSALLKALGLLKKPSFSIVLVLTVIISATHVIYFMQCAKFLSAVGLPDSYIMPAMAIGQFFEVFMYLALGKALPRFGFKAVMSIGVAFFAVRFAIFGTIALPIWVMVAAQALHGVCYAFFFGACFIYADRVAPPDIRNSAQATYNFVFYGVGPLVAVALNSFLAGRYAHGGKALALEGFADLWYTLAGIVVCAWLVFMFFFRDESSPAKSGAP